MRISPLILVLVLLLQSPSSLPSVHAQKDASIAVEIEVSRFRIKRDFDPKRPGVAQPVFFFDVKGIDDDFDNKVDEEDGDWMLFPEKVNAVLNVMNLKSYHVGPLYVLDHLVSTPIEAAIRIADLDLVISRGKVEQRYEQIATVKFSIEEVPWNREFDDANVSMRISARPISPSRLSYAYASPEDSYNTKQWYWFEVGADRVWRELEDELSEVVVAVIDTGIDFGHSDLQGKFWLNPGEGGTDAKGRPKQSNGVDDDKNGFVDDWRGWDFYAGDNDPRDPDGHGTAVAGVIAARRGGGGIVGVAPNVKIMALRVGKGVWRYSAIINAVKYAVKMGAHVISMSFGGGENNSGLRKALQNAYKRGVVLVAAAGNERSPRPFFPAAYGEVISVSALQRLAPSNDPRHRLLPANEDLEAGASYLTLSETPLYGFSNFGPSLTAAEESVELSSPGSLITTTLPNGAYNSLYGTSFSAPIVSAVAALILGYAKQRDVTLAPTVVRGVLAESAADLGAGGWDPYYGYGAVNAAEALNKVDELIVEIGLGAKTNTGDALPGVKLKVDGKTYATPSELNMLRGEHSLKAPSSFKAGAQKLTFSHWEDEAGNILSKKTNIKLSFQSDGTIYSVYRKAK